MKSVDLDSAWDPDDDPSLFEDVPLPRDLENDRDRRRGETHRLRIEGVGWRERRKALIEAETIRRTGSPNVAPMPFWQRMAGATALGVVLLGVGGYRLASHSDWTQWLTGPLLIVLGTASILFVLWQSAKHLIRGSSSRRR
jgi:hypothetical protein